MIDMHSHIIYGIDDGARDEESTLQMLKLAEISGTTTIVATPHYMKGRFITPYEEVVERVYEIRKLARDNNIDVEIMAGQEIYYHKDLIYYYNDKLIGTINNSRYMLIEFPMMEFNIDDIIDGLYELTIRGIVPIIAHPERYKPFIKKPHLINKFIEEGYLFQMNSGSLLGKFGRDVQRLAETYYNNGIYSVIGSDAHSSNSRNTNLEPLQDLIKDGISVFDKNAEKILQDEEVLFTGKMIKEKRGFLSLFSR